MHCSYLNFHVENSIAYIELNRPENGNAFNIGLAEELEKTARFCQADSSIRAVILTGAGKLFSCGGDLSYMSMNEDQLDVVIKELADRLHTAYSTFARIPAPLIAVVHGPAAGIGMSLALIADITIASDRASFIPAYKQVGLSPDGGLTYLLPRIVGKKRAQDILLLNKKLSATDALNIGMISQVVNASDLTAFSQSVAEELAAGPSLALADTKSLLLASDSNSLEQQMHLEGLRLAANSITEDGREGRLAFSEGRNPIFVGY